jgi:type II secretory pathway component PulF
VLSNVFIKNKIDTLYSAIKNGSCLSVEMKKLCPAIFPLIVVQIISIGEKTGDLSHAFQFASLHITNEIDQKNKIFIKLLGPILIVFISCLIGLIMLVTIVPLFEIYTKIN